MYIFILGVDLFRDKTSDLRSQTVKVVTFEHIPAMSRQVKYLGENSTTGNVNKTVIYSGLEIEVNYNSYIKYQSRTLFS